MTEKFTLPTRLDTSAAAALFSSLLAVRGRPIDIDASGVETIGALACEVLVSAQRQWAADGMTIRITCPSPAFLSVIATLGLHSEINWSEEAVPA